MVGQAGLTLEQIANKPWEELIQSELLTPLGMTDTLHSSIEARKSGRMATPYTAGRAGQPPQQLQEDVDDWVDLVKPAGSIYSSATDMSKWMLFHLGHTPALLSKAVLEQLHTAQVTMDPPSAIYLSNSRSTASIVPVGYGYGWLEVAFDGHQMVTHSGGVLGFWSDLSIWPLDDFGVFISSPAVSLTPTSLIELWVWFELLGMDNVVAKVYCRGEGEEEDDETRKENGWDETIDGLLQSMKAHHKDHELLKPFSLRSDAPLSFTRPTSPSHLSLAPDQFIGSYTNLHGPAWGSLHITSTSNSTYPLSVQWESWLLLLTPNSTEENSFDGVMVEPAKLLPLFGEALVRVLVFNVTGGEVRGVAFRLDQPIPYFVAESSMRSSSSTGVGESSSSSSGGGGGGGGGEGEGSGGASVLMVAVLSVVSIALLAVVVYAVWITKKYNDQKAGGASSRRSDLSDSLMS